jgi:hypothetical protein
MKAFVTLHKVPEVTLLATGFHRGLIMKNKTGGYLVAMKTLLHYDQTAGNIYHLPQM